MSTVVLLLLALLLHTGQVACSSDNVGCRFYEYLYTGSCRPCPVNCSSCVSDTNCTECKKGFYGLACENKCGKKCTCHKTYGYCTDGCPDKEYPEEGNGCGSCPGHCALCESQSKCFLCEDGFFGVTCQEKCQDQCARCHNTTGQCFQCKELYYLLGGQCNSCPHGCSSCNTADNCQSCEDAFNGPFDGRCIIKCPGNGVREYVVPDENGRCGLWQDIDNICHGYSESQSCISFGNCLQYVRSCLVTEDCVTDTNDARCGNVMQYECKNICSRYRTRYRCEDTCIVFGIPTDNATIICLANTLTVRQTFQNQGYCNEEEVSRTGNDSSSRKDAIIYVLSMVVLVLFIVLVIVLVVVFGDKVLKKRSQKNKAKDKNIELSEDRNKSGQADGNPKSDESERQPESESAEHDNNTGGNFSSTRPTTDTMDTGYEGSRPILDLTNRQNMSETPKSAESSSSQPLLDRNSPETGHKESRVKKPTTDEDDATAVTFSSGETCPKVEFYY